MGKSKLWQGSALASILVAVNAVNLAEVDVPDQKVCRHFKAFGKVDDFTKKLFAYKWQLEAEVDELFAGFNRKAERSIDMPHGSEAELAEAKKKRIDAIQLEVGFELGPIINTIDVLDSIIRAEVGRQFSDSLNSSVEKFVVKDDWTIGWLDHSNVGQEFLGMVLSTLGDALTGGLAEANLSRATGGRRRRGGDRPAGDDHAHDHEHAHGH